jgi:glutamine synthetase
MTDPSNLDDFEWLQLTFVDVFGNSRSLAIPGTHLARAFSAGVVFDGSALEGRARYLESSMRLVPQPETLVDLGQGRARVVCAVMTPDGEPWAGDPRTALVSVIDASGAFAESARFSAELEFYLLDEANQPIDAGGYFDDADSPGIRLVRRAADELLSYGIDIDVCHHEAGPAQYEIDLAPVPAATLGDALVITKQTVRRLATEIGLTPTFMASPLRGLPGSGLHVHQRSPELVDDDGSLTVDGRSYLAGQLAHARGLSALVAPNINSYRRLHSGAEAPSAAIWGHRNRAALIRFARELEADASIEFRGADPSANPYLLLAGLIACGRAGVDQRLELPGPNDEEPGTYDPSSAVRFDALPRHLDEALDALVADDVLVDAFDPLLLEILESGRRAELEDYRSLVTSWETEHYLREA